MPHVAQQELNSCRADAWVRGWEYHQSLLIGKELDFESAMGVEKKKP